MRHRASLLASMEGISRATFMIARELSQNSRSGLTPRFLAKKLELPLEEVEYLVDVNPKLLYLDLTKIRLAPEGFHAVKRILEGLESHGDVAAFTRRIRNLPDQDLQRIEERLALDEGLSKKELAEKTLGLVYQRPDSVMNYVASHDFSDRAREVFDTLWQSRNGVMNVSQLYAAHGAAEYEIEQALWELFQGCACFELFRFDSEDRLIRAAALLKEIRDFRKNDVREQSDTVSRLKAVKEEVQDIRAADLYLSETVCRLTAAIAARPARLRNDGELFLEARRRLERICPDSAEPSLNTCLWIAEGVEWIARVDNTVRAGALDAIVGLDRMARHRILVDWLTGQPEEARSRALLEQALEDIRVNAWYPVMDFLHYARKLVDQADAPRLKHAGAHFEYISPSVSGGVESRLARSLEEAFAWLGIVDRGYVNGEPCFRIPPLGAALLTGAIPAALSEKYPERRGRIVVQPNYEIVTAHDDMDPLLTVPLEIFAERVSTSNVTVYRLSQECFVRAMQEGRNADAFIEFLLNNSREPLPDNVLRTLKDWRGTAKRVRLRTWHVLEAEDPLVVAELEHYRRWRENLDHIDPHKALRYNDISRAELIRALEKDGYIVQ